MSLTQQKEYAGQLYILKPRTQTRAKEKVDPYFEVLAKNEQGKWTETDSTTQVTGDLVKVEHKQSEWEGNKFDNVNLTLRDSEKEESYLIELKLTLLNKSMLNSLFNLKSFDGLKISLYTGGKGFPSAAVRQHGELVKWKFGLDQIPKPTQVILRGQKVNDYYEIDQWFLQRVGELSATVNSNYSGNPNQVRNSKKVVESTPAKSAPDPVDPNNQSDDSDDQALF